MNRMVKLMVGCLVLVGLWLGLAEYTRVSARASVEQDMRARFESLVCPPDQVRGDICGDDVNKGRCVTGDYIDYRTVWGRVTSRQQVFDLLRTEYVRSHTPQTFVNWLACQGFTQPRYFPDGSSVTRTPHIHFWSYAKFGFGPFGYTTWYFPIGALRAPYQSSIRLFFNKSAQIESMGMSFQQGNFDF